VQIGEEERTIRIEPVAVPLPVTDPVPFVDPDGTREPLRSPEPAPSEPATLPEGPVQVSADRWIEPMKVP
jgi:hypothetical protein